MIKRIFTKRSSLNYTHPQHPRYAGRHSPHSSSEESEIFKIVSYNIKHSKRINEASRLINEHKELCNPDVICVQEMTLSGIRFLAKELNYNYVYYPAIIHPAHGQDFGNAILTRWPIHNDRKIILPSPYAKRLQRIAVGAEIAVHGKKILVYSVHMAVILKAAQRSRQIQSLLTDISDTVQYCIIAGDFNTFSRRYHRAVIQPFLSAGFALATSSVGWTYKHWYLLNKKTILDHIFVRNIDVIKAGKVIDWKPSDHLPVWSQLKLR